MRRIKDAFTPVPEETLARVEDTLLHLPRKEERNVSHGRPRMAIALALVLVLTLCGGAIAAERLGVLNFLFWSDTPTAEQLKLVQDVSLTQETEMATITVTDAVFDGQQLSIGLVFDTDRPTYVYAEEVWVNSQLQVNPNNERFLYWVNRDERSCQALAGLSVAVTEELTDLADVEIRLTLLTPEKALVLIERIEDQTQVRQALADGLTPISDHGSLPYIEGISGQSTSTAAEYAAAYHMNLEEVSLIFTIDTDRISASDTIHLDVDNNDQLPFTVVVRRAELTPLGSHFMLDIYPKAGGIENPLDLARCFQLPFAFYDEQQETVSFQPSVYSGGNSVWMQDENGLPFYRMVEEEGPVSTTPDCLRLVHHSWYSNVPYWQWAIELRPVEEPVAHMAGTQVAIIQSPDQSLPFHLFAAEALITKDQLMCVAEMNMWEGELDALESIWAASGIYDMSRQPLTFTPRILSLDETDDGYPLYMVTQYAELPETLPDAVYMVPLDSGTGEPLWDWALFLPVVQTQW